MKIGLLTFHRAHNYGAVLQCYALQQVLRSFGHDVEIIDYRQPFIEKLYRVHLNKKLILRLIISFGFREIVRYIKQDYVQSIKSYLFFKSFRKKYLQVSSIRSETDTFYEFDAIVIGSDQLWSLYCTKRYEKLYWGDLLHSNDAKVIGYAISSVLDFEELISLQKVQANLGNFTALSLREKSAQQYFIDKFGLYYPTTLDPTLLTTPATWTPLINKSWEQREYVVVYELRIPCGEYNFVFDKASLYAKENSLEIIDLSNMNYSVEDFVSIISCARAVFTSSFHAIVFSLIFSRPFCAFDLGDGKEIRYTNLLNALGLQDFIFTRNSVITMLPKIKEMNIESKLEDLRKESMSFLKNSLK